MSFFKPKPQGSIGRMADYAMLPIMYVLQGNFRESPQRTHRWNNLHLSNRDIDHLSADKIETVAADKESTSWWIGPIPHFHMPIFGGWNKFVIIEPKVPQKIWFVGWVLSDTCGISKIPLTSKVRLGIGPLPLQFFGVDFEGRQIDIDIVGYGMIGKAGEFAKVPLL